jgi:CheY-like chemotaxis protein
LDAYKGACQESSPLAARIDVILMDINMPEMDGMEATRQIRAYERDHELPPVTIIALTGVASSEAQQEAHASGVNLFLIKPVRLGDLEVVLKGVVTSEEAEKKMERREKDEISVEHSAPTYDERKESQRSSSETHKKTKSLI